MIFYAKFLKLQNLHLSTLQNTFPMMLLWVFLKMLLKFSLKSLASYSSASSLIFIVSNSEPVTISFLGWKLVKDIGAWLLIVLAGLAGIVVFLIARRIRSVVRDFRRIRAESKTQDNNTQATDTPHWQ